MEDLKDHLTSVLFRKRRRPEIDELHSNCSPTLTSIESLVGGPCQDSCTLCSEERPSFRNLQCHQVTLTVYDDSDPSQRLIQLIFIHPKYLEPPYPTVLFLHSTGKSSLHHQTFHRAIDLTKTGSQVVLLNSRYHGCRKAPGSLATDHYMQALVRAWRNNFSTYSTNIYPFIFDTAADLVSVADYLSSLKYVDCSRLGIAGISLGGMHSWFAAAIDKRWTAVAPLIGVQSFNYAIDENCFHARVESIREVFNAAADDAKQDINCEVVRKVWNRICPGLLDHFDARNTLPLLYPRPVFIGNGEVDPRCPIEGVRRDIKYAKETCLRLYGDEGRFQLEIYEGVGHQVTDKMWDDCVSFFEREFSSCSTDRDHIGGRIDN